MKKQILQIFFVLKKCGTHLISRLISHIYNSSKLQNLFKKKIPQIKFIWRDPVYKHLNKRQGKTDR